MIDELLAESLMMRLAIEADVESSQIPHDFLPASKDGGLLAPVC